MKNLLSLRENQSVKATSPTHRMVNPRVMMFFSRYSPKKKRMQFKKRDHLAGDRIEPPVYSPILFEDEEVIVYENHPIYETVEMSDRDYRESRKNEDLKFKISGLESQVAVIDVYPGQKIKSETDKVIYFSEGIEMITILGGFMSSFKRLFTGSTLFMTEYSFKFEKGFGRVAFAENFPSKIIPIRFTDYQGEIICQKGAFLCGTEDVEIDLEFSKTFKTGFFGGDYVFQKLKGTGTCLIHAGGSIIKRRLRVKERIKVSIGLIVAYENSVKYEKEFVKGVKNMIGAGSLVVATLTGPGDVFLQTMHFEDLVNEIVDNIKTGRSLKQERPKNINKGDENEELIKLLEEERRKRKEAMSIIEREGKGGESIIYDIGQDPNLDSKSVVIRDPHMSEIMEITSEKNNPKALAVVDCEEEFVNNVFESTTKENNQIVKLETKEIQDKNEKQLKSKAKELKLSEKEGNDKEKDKEKNISNNKEKKEKPSQSPPPSQEK